MGQQFYRVVLYNNIIIYREELISYNIERDILSKVLKVDSNGNNRFRFRPSNHLLGKL